MFYASLYSTIICITLLSQLGRVRALVANAPIAKSCTPFETTFPQGSVGPNSPDLIPYDTATSAYAVSPTDGLELYLDRPSGTIRHEGRVNNLVASGASINSTLLTLYGKFTFEVRAPPFPGVVVAAILTAPGGDEIDIEVLGGDSKHWQTNIFAPQPSEKEPLYGVFGGLESFQTSSDTVGEFHKYSIDWNSERIIWGVDGKEVRTINQYEKNGVYHFPSHPMRIQLGIWDASSPAGTSEWANGPINWSAAPARMTATFRSLRIECD